jgi:uncharacterized protein YbaR (Trm112 family)
MALDIENDVAPELIALLRCPETMLPLAMADAALLAEIEQRRGRGALRDRAGKPVSERLTAGLVRADRKLIYPVRHGIPVLLVEEGILLE